jgi:hypothetical protein
MRMIEGDNVRSVGVGKGGSAPPLPLKHNRLKPLAINFGRYSKYLFVWGKTPGHSRKFLKCPLPSAARRDIHATY